MQLTYFGGNSWFLELANLKILIDPWLVDTLTFGGQRWFFEACNQTLRTIPPQVDLILLSQGLPDHAHRPTLEKLDRTIPVVGSATAAKVAESLGYQQVTALKPGEIHVVAESLEILALAGAPVPQVENGYLLTQRQNGLKLYYEPHGFVAANLKDYAPVDVVLSPVVNLELPLGLKLVQGQDTAWELVQSLSPQVFLPTTQDTNIEYSGLLMNVLKTKGNVSSLRDRVTAEQLLTEVLELELGKPYPLTLTLPPQALPESPFKQFLQSCRDWWQGTIATVSRQLPPGQTGQVAQAQESTVPNLEV
jgi:L-ascorbate metabolism protein UlaG (beta-lactamase superfamily)